MIAFLVRSISSPFNFNFNKLEIRWLRSCPQGIFPLTQCRKEYFYLVTLIFFNSTDTSSSTSLFLTSNLPMFLPLQITYFFISVFFEFSYTSISSSHAVASVLRHLEIVCTKQLDPLLLESALLKFSGHRQNLVLYFARR